jgi:hypothetical protein
MPASIIDVIHAVGQFLIREILPFCPHAMPKIRLALRLTESLPHNTRGRDKYPQTKLLAVLKKWGWNPFLQVRSNDLGMLLKLVGMKLSESRKWIYSAHILRILVLSIINIDTHLSSRNLKINCASQRREL